MSYEEVIEKYKRLHPQARRQVNDLIERLTATAVNEEGNNPPSLFGILKGKIWMSPDFDEPLEDFKDYM